MLTRRDVAKALGAAGAALLVGPAPRAFARPIADDPLRLVDPELRAAAAIMLAQRVPPMTSATLPARRASWVAPAALSSPAASVEARNIPGRRGDPPVAVEVIGVRAGAAPRPAILHIHGGGMVSGSARHMTAFCQATATDLNCIVVNVDYRLSPETPYPGPVEDNYAALVWLARNAAVLGVDPTRIAVMGGSAGGGLAAMVAIVARDRGEVRLCHQTLFYPMLDDRTGSSRSVPPHIGKILWTSEANSFGWTAFLGVPAGSGRVPRGAVPAREADLSGLPPAFIGVGALDLFVDEDIDFAHRLVDAGVPTQLLVTPGAYHAFDLIVPGARVSREFTVAWQNALKAAFAVHA